MKQEIIKAEDYGLEVKQATELTVGLIVVKDERKLLIEEFKEVSKLELTPENLPKFKDLRLRILRNRTQGINKWHKTNKEFFLTGGKFVDAIKNKENAINEQMEEKLIDAEKHFDNLAKERIAKRQAERVFLLSEFVEDASERDLATMDQDVWEVFLATKKQAHLDRVQAKLDAEKERQAKIKAEKEEQERIQKENEKLHKEAKEREEKAKLEAEKRAKEEEERNEKARLLHLEQLEKERQEKAKYEAKIKEERDAKEKIEREEKEKREKLEALLKEKEELELAQKKQKEADYQSELNKGDSAKVKDLISDLESLKSKYTFKSAKNQKMYSNVGTLIDKVTNFIN